MPILPFLADDEATLETLVSWAAEAKADYMLTGMLYLTGGIRAGIYLSLNSITLSISLLIPLYIPKVELIKTTKVKSMVIYQNEVEIQCQQPIFQVST